MNKRAIQIEDLRKRCLKHCIRSNVTDSQKFKIEVFHMHEGKRVIISTPKQTER